MYKHQLKDNLDMTAVLHKHLLFPVERSAAEIVISCSYDHAVATHWTNHVQIENVYYLLAITNGLQPMINKTCQADNLKTNRASTTFTSETSIL